MKQFGIYIDPHRRGFYGLEALFHSWLLAGFVASKF